MQPSPAGTDLREPRNRVSRRAISYWTVKALLGWMIAGAVGGFLVYVVPAQVGRWQFLGTGAAVLVAVTHLLVMPRWRYRVHRWELTETAVYTQSGWLRQERRIAPISRVQTIDRERGPLEQLFGLANVTVTTASAAGPLSIDGLDIATAEYLVEKVTATAETAEGDAT